MRLLIRVADRSEPFNLFAYGSFPKAVKSILPHDQTKTRHKAGFMFGCGGVQPTLFAIGALERHTHQAAE